MNTKTRETRETRKRNDNEDWLVYGHPATALDKPGKVFGYRTKYDEFVLFPMSLLDKPGVKEHEATSTTAISLGALDERTFQEVTDALEPVLVTELVDTVCEDRGVSREQATRRVLREWCGFNNNVLNTLPREIR